MGRRLVVGMILASVVLGGCFALFSLDEYGPSHATTADGGGVIDVDATTTDGRTTPPPPPPSIIVIAADKKLYRIDPKTFERALLADLAACPELREIAIDKSGRIVVTAQLAAGGGVFALDLKGMTAQCTRKADAGAGDIPALAFIGNPPELLGVDGTRTFVRLDVATGAPTSVGGGDQNAYGDLAEGSGVLYGVAGKSVITIDRTSGATASSVGDLPDDQSLGLAFADGRLFVFSRTGRLYVVRPDPFDVVTVDAGIGWSGAASPPSP